MMILIVDENTLELGLENAYNSFNQSATVFFNKQGLNTSLVYHLFVIKMYI